MVNTLDENLKLDNGVLFFEEVPFEGILVSYYEPKKIKSKVEYVNGKKHGSETQWYKNGTKLVERFYSEGFKIGIHKSWWDDGTPKFEYHFNNKGEFDGIVKEWYKNAQIFRDFNYVAGKEIGSQRMWKDDGSLKANYEVVNGERFGLIGLKKCYTVTANEDEIK
jgi:antitoxin component YwqK of YwqJK toxin-antitoxin module